MLRSVMGDSAFVRGWRDYGAAHKYANGSVADFQAAMEGRYGASLAWFFDEWIYDRSYPIYRVSTSSSPKAGGGYYNYLKLDQVQTSRPYFDMPVDLKLHTASGDTLVQTRPPSRSSVLQVELANPVLSVTLDPNTNLLHREVTGGAVVDSPGEIAPARLRFAGIRRQGRELRVDFETPAAATSEKFELALFDVQGRKVVTLWAGAGPAAPHSTSWAGRGAAGEMVSPGVYFARLGSDSRSITAKVVWIR